MVKTFLKYKDKIYLYLTYLLVFLFLVFPYSDKDWGWHFKLGEYFLKNWHFMPDNPFTWTLPYYQWTNHEWLYDPLLYLLSKSIGFTGLSILGAIVCFLTFYIIVRLYKLSYWKIGILGFFFVKLVEVGILEGFRAQVLSNFLLAVLVVILIKAQRNFKLLFTLPLLFLAWVNLHGTFSLGLLVATIFLATDLAIRFIKKDKEALNRLMIYTSIGVATGLLTLVNPFGFKVYLEALKHASNPYLQNVVEWLPATRGCTYCHNYTFYLYVALLAFAVFKIKKAEAVPFAVLGLAFLVPSINARRYLQNFIVLTLPILALYLQETKLNLEKFKSTAYIFGLILTVGVIYNFFGRFTAFDLYKYDEIAYCKFTQGCSPTMADYLIKHNLEGRGFNFYDWGGYYIGKGIPERLFIDGRMHLWKLDDYMPFADYIAMYYGQDYQKFLEYKFDWVLVPLDSDIGQTIYNTDNLGAWKIEFQDGNTILYTRR